MNVGINEFLLKIKTIAFDFNFHREGEKKSIHLSRVWKIFKKKK